MITSWLHEGFSGIRYGSPAELISDNGPQIPNPGDPTLLGGERHQMAAISHLQYTKEWACEAMEPNPQGWRPSFRTDPLREWSVSTAHTVLWSASIDSRPASCRALLHYYICIAFKLTRPGFGESDPHLAKPDQPKAQPEAAIGC